MGPEKSQGLYKPTQKNWQKIKQNWEGGGGNQEKQDKWGEAELCKVFDNSPNTAGLWTYFILSI